MRQFYRWCRQRTRITRQDTTMTITMSRPATESSLIDLDEAAAIAAQYGWTDCSRFKRSTVLHQMTSDIDGLMVFVTVNVDGTIRWNVLSDVEEPSDYIRAQRGDATSIPAAITACEDAVAAIRGTLF